MTSQTQNGAGTQQTTNTSFTSRLYYDAACTSVWRSATGTQVVTNDMNDDEYYNQNTTEQETVYSTSGQSLEVDQVTTGLGLAPAPGDTTGNVTAVSTNGETDSFTYDCYDKLQDCEFGDVQRLPTADTYPATGVFVEDMVSGAAAASTSYVAYDVQGADAATMFGNNGIVGQSVTQNLQETRSTTIDGSGASVQTISFVDTTNDVTSTATFGNQDALATATISGTISQTSKALVVATFSVDVNGYGAITYSDGSQGKIAGFAVLK